MRRIALVLLVGTVALLPQGSALAGGWWTTLDFHDQYVGIGESLSIKANEVHFSSIEAAEEAEHVDYFAYLVEDFDERSLERAMSRANPKDWWRPLTRPIRIGTVTLMERDANLSRARVRLSVPDVPTGRYSLMLCDAGCKNPLADHIPVPVTVTADAFAAQTARRLSRLNDRLTLALARVRGDVRRSQRQINRLQATAAEAPAPVEAREAPTTDRNDRPPWIAYAGWFLAGCLVVALIRGRRSRRPDDILLERVPDDARELTTTP